MRSVVIIGEGGTDHAYPRGSENPYRYVSYRTARGSRVQNREMEDGGYGVFSDDEKSLIRKDVRGRINLIYRT